MGLDLRVCVEWWEELRVEFSQRATLRYHDAFTCTCMGCVTDEVCSLGSDDYDSCPWLAAIGAKRYGRRARGMYRIG